jgi:hypothetical protein
MSLFNNVVQSIEDNVDVRKSGKSIAIPFYKMPRLSKILPGILRGRSYLYTAGSKEGKTQLTDFLHVYQAIEWLMENPNSGLSLKVIYFSLELSKETKIAQAICYRLYTKYNIIISPDYLLSVYDNYILDEEVLNIIKSDEFQEWFKFFEECVEFVDFLRHPTGINIYVDQYAKNNGSFLYKEIDWEENGEKTKRKVVDKYIANNPNQIVEIIIDHYSLLAEKGKSTYECIKDISSNHQIKWRDRYNYTPVGVQQQSADSLSMQFTNRGDNILEKVKPSPEGLANCKDTRQDVNLMIGIFSPYKYKEEEYEGWDLTRIRDNHREISILMNRNGKSNATVQAYFNGAINLFKELPRDPNLSIYRFVDKLRLKEESYG